MPIRIFFGYRHKENAWGGANSFLRTLYNAIQENEKFQLTHDYNDPCDLIFLNQLNRGPGGDKKKWSIKSIAKKIRSIAKNGKKKPCLIVRAVNLRRNVDIDGGILTRIIGYYNDLKVIKLLNMADLVIFQSNYTKKVFINAGYQGKSSVVIYNSADPVYCEKSTPNMSSTEKLRLIAVSFSTRNIKKHYLMAKISLIRNTEVTYIGNWPRDTNSHNVKLMGVLNKSEIKKLMVKNHYLLHPAIRDACPNSIVEGLSAGLPVIYNSQEGSSAELVGNAGFAINEANIESTVIHARLKLRDYKLAVLRQRKKFLTESIANQYLENFIKVYQMQQGK